MNPKQLVSCLYICVFVHISVCMYACVCIYLSLRVDKGTRGHGVCVDGDFCGEQIVWSFKCLAEMNSCSCYEFGDFKVPNNRKSVKKVQTFI